MGHAKSRLRSPVTMRSVLVGSIMLFGVFQLGTQIQFTNRLPTNSYGRSDEIAVVPNNGIIATDHSGNSTIKDGKDLLPLYNPFLHPVFQTPPTSPLKVGIVSTTPLSGETLHFLYDGVIRSSMMDLVGVVSLFNKNESSTTTIPQPVEKKPTKRNPFDVQLWIVDGNRVAKLQRSFLDNLIHDPAPPWKVLIVDFSDRVQFQLRHYHRLGIWDKSHVRVAFRSIVQGRFFSSDKSEIHQGYVAPNLATAGGTMLHCPYAVRSDIFEALEVELKRLGGVSTDNVPRPIDIYHPWQISAREGKSKYRNAVSMVVRSWNGTIWNRRLIETSIEEHGPRRMVGRNTANQEYIQALLFAKIVVVTQKDDWIDHYRLMEALVCGPLVLADEILAPPTGLVHGKNIVFFSNLTHLEQLAQYYLSHEKERLEIARAGRHVAMTQHRSWHRMESLVFGKVITPL
jgi:hypothetical protein